VWVGCDDGLIVVFDAKSREKLASLVPQVVGVERALAQCTARHRSQANSASKVGVTSIIALTDTVWSANREGGIIVWCLADKVRAWRVWSSVVIADAQAFKQLKTVTPPVCQ
jgi:hypothetical protein